jgi:hypothetical protein
MSWINKSGNWWAGVITVTNTRIRNEILLQRASQDTEIVIKHPVLLNMCHHNFVHSFVTKSLFRYLSDPVFHFLFFHISCSLIDFVFFMRPYP